MRRCCAGWPTGQDLYVSFVTSEINGFNANLEPAYNRKVLIHSFAPNDNLDPEPGNRYTYLLSRTSVGSGYTYARILRVDFSNIYMNGEPFARVMLTREAPSVVWVAAIVHITLIPSASDTLPRRR